MCVCVCVYCCVAHGQDWRVREPGIAALPPLQRLIQDYGLGEGRRLSLAPGIGYARVLIAFGGFCSRGRLPLPGGPPPLFSVRNTGKKINVFTGCRKSKG